MLGAFCFESLGLGPAIQRPDLKVDKQPEEVTVGECLIPFDDSAKAEHVVANSDVLRFSVQRIDHRS